MMLRRPTTVIVIIDPSGTRRYYTGLRWTDGARWFAADPTNQHVLRYLGADTAAYDRLALEAEGYVVVATDIYYERPGAS